MRKHADPAVRALNPYTTLGFSILINGVYSDASPSCCWCIHPNGECTDFAKDGTCQVVSAIGPVIQDIFELAAHEDRWLVLRCDMERALRRFWEGSVEEFLKEAQSAPCLIIQLSISADFQYLWRWQDPWDGDGASLREMVAAGEGYQKLSIGKP